MSNACNQMKKAQQIRYHKDFVRLSLPEKKDNLKCFNENGLRDTYESIYVNKMQNC